MSGFEHETSAKRPGKATSESRQRIARPASEATDLVDQILHLQRTIGNQSVTQLLRHYQPQPNGQRAVTRQAAAEPVHGLGGSNEYLEQARAEADAEELQPVEAPPVQRKLDWDKAKLDTEFGPSTKSGYKSIAGLLDQYNAKVTTAESVQAITGILTKIETACANLLKLLQKKKSVKHDTQTAAITKLQADIAKERVLLKKEAFDALAQGGVKEKNAPGAITIPDEWNQGMAKAWSGSLPGGVSQEQGGLLVRNDDGSYEWKEGAPGASGFFTPDWGSVGADQSLVGSGHTHPYGADEGGHTDVSFSGDDISTMIVTGEKMAIVQSGTGQFVVSTTKEFDDMVAKLKPDKKDDAMKKMNDLWDKSFANAKGTFQQRVEKAVKVLCKKYHLIYYKGSGGELAKQ